ncbi:MAG: glycosyltransferase family 2 protein, partial [Arenimonas sp.]
MATIESGSDQSQPLVSVGIPTFNRPEGLSRVLQCIQKQTYKNIEVIVSDNCTPGEKINQLMNSIVSGDGRFRYFRQENNIGVVANFEFVLCKSSGKYFLWAADDDLCEENFIERIVTVLEEGPDIVLCTSDVKIINNDDTLLSISKLESIRVSNNWKRARRFFFYYPTSNLFFCIYGIFRTEALKHCGIEYVTGWKKIPIFAEVVFLAKFSELGRIVS